LLLRDSINDIARLCDCLEEVLDGDIGIRGLEGLVGCVVVIGALGSPVVMGLRMG